MLDKCTYLYGGNNPSLFVDPTGREYSMVGLGAAVAGIGILSLSGTSPVRGPNRSADGGSIWANLRAREAGGVIFDHRYIEFVDRRKGERLVFEALPDWTPHLRRADGYLHGMAPRPWGKVYKRGHDPEAPFLPNRLAFEVEDDSYSPLLGVSQSTYDCLERVRRQYYSQPVLYDAQENHGGHNSNWWVVNVCKACGLTYVWLPGIVTLGANTDEAFGSH